MGVKGGLFSSDIFRALGGWLVGVWVGVWRGEIVIEWMRRDDEEVDGRVRIDYLEYRYCRLGAT